MNIKFTGALFLLFLFLFSGISFAKSKNVEVKFNTQEMYDSNIFYSDSNKENDFVTSLEPGIKLNRKIKKAEITANADPKVLFYAKNSDLNVTNYNVSENFSYQINRYATAAVSNANIHDIVTYLTETGALGATGRLEYDFNNINPSFILDSAAGSTLIGKFTLDRFSFDSPNVPDSDGKQYSAGYSQRLNKLLTALADFGYDNRHYDTGFEAHVYLMDGGISWTINKRLKNDARVGIQFTNQDSATSIPGTSEGTGHQFYYSDILTFVLSRMVTISLLSQISSQIIDVQNNVLAVWQNTLNMAFQLTKRDQARLSGSYVHADTDFVEGRSRIWKGEVSWKHRLSKYFSFRFGFSYENNNSDFSPDYSRYLGFVSLDANY